MTKTSTQAHDAGVGNRPRRDIVWALVPPEAVMVNVVGSLNSQELKEGRVIRERVGIGALGVP